ncbi:MAG: hypothetical protein Ct9H300mP8_00910 [Gammaproteobacteria bacterium]|nr:MAG: hypothetical protein Ct9H300mP8_00910 [Gammaproteobacteria bacterium]
MHPYGYANSALRWATYGSWDSICYALPLQPAFHQAVARTIDGESSRTQDVYPELSDRLKQMMGITETTKHLLVSFQQIKDLVRASRLLLAHTQKEGFSRLRTWCGYYFLVSPASGKEGWNWLYT